MPPRVPASPIFAILPLSPVLILTAESAMAIEDPADTLVRQYPQFEPRRYARYHAPFVPWFMRSNEALVQVARRAVARRRSTLRK